jgi:hypothetical protein
MDLSANGENEIFFVDGAENSLTRPQKEVLTSASAHYLECFDITTEVDVYISKRSVLHKLGNNTLAWHMPPSYSGDNSIVCVFVDPESDVQSMLSSLAHEMIHAWQVDRGDLSGRLWKGEDMSHLPYQFQPWEIEAYSHESKIAECFYQDHLLTKSELREISEKTDAVFSELLDVAKSVNMKAKLKKVGSVAAALGLGALLGM